MKLIEAPLASERLPRLALDKRQEYVGCAPSESQRSWTQVGSAVKISDSPARKVTGPGRMATELTVRLVQMAWSA